MFIRFICWFYAGYIIYNGYMLKRRIKNIFYSLNRNKTYIIDKTRIKLSKKALYQYKQYMDIMRKV